MFAVIKTGGKQYKIEPNDYLRIERIEGEPGSSVQLDRVLMIGTDETVLIGSPVIEDAVVNAKIVEQGKGKKIIVGKKKRRKKYRRKIGHRQLFTGIRVESIQGPFGVEEAPAAEEEAEETKTEAESAASIEDSGDTEPESSGAETEEAAEEVTEEPEMESPDESVEESEAPEEEKRENE